MTTATNTLPEADLLAKPAFLPKHKFITKGKGPCMHCCTQLVTSSKHRCVNTTDINYTNYYSPSHALYFSAESTKNAGPH